MLFDFFKSNKNPKDDFPFVIPSKPKPFSLTSSSGSKVKSKFDFLQINPTMQLVYLGGLPTYVAFSVVDLSKINVIIKEEESKLPPPKKPKRILTYLEMSKCMGYSIPMGRDIEKWNWRSSLNEMPCMFIC